jgi:hypothetical protein
MLLLTAEKVNKKRKSKDEIFDNFISELLTNNLKISKFLKDKNQDLVNISDDCKDPSSIPLNTSLLLSN